MKTVQSEIGNGVLSISNAITWCINCHVNTNHYYDAYLPYEFHLRMVAQVFEDFKYLLNEKHQYECRLACFGHDLIEDTRTSYNDVLEKLGKPVADIVYAVSNEKGKTRKERANDEYYKGIRETPGAVFVKLCDRIANVQYSKMTKSRMFELYKKENANFVESLGYYPSVTNSNYYYKMFEYLESLFN